MSGPGPVRGERVGDAAAGDAPAAVAGPAPTGDASGRAAADRRHERRGSVYAALGLVVLLTGAYAAAVVLSGDDVPSGTEVAGIGLGGLSPEAAEARLRSELGPRARAPVELVAGERTFRLEPASLGLSFDVDATVARADGGNRLDPRRVWADLTATIGPVAPVVDVDQDKLIAAVHRVAERVERPAKEPWIDFVEQRPVTHRAVRGLSVDTSAAILALLDAWLVERGPVVLPVETVYAEVDGLAVQRAVSRLARPAVEQQVRLRVGADTFSVPPRVYAPALRFEVRDGALAPVLQAEQLARRMPRAVTSGLRQPRNASVELRRGAPTVVADRPGMRIRPVDAAEALGRALTRRDRTARVTGQPVPAELSTREVRSWRIRRPVASSAAPYRSAEGVRLAARLNGTVVPPGGTFSLGAILGERSEGVPDAGRLATALYRAAFAAGMQVVEHHPHQVYDGSFTRGHDATLNWPDDDLRFAGTSPYGVLVQAWAPSGQLHVRLWSTRYWDVTTRTSAPFDWTPAGRRVSIRPGCDPRPGLPGFTVSVARTLHHDSQERSTTTRTTYNPRPALVCRRPAR